MGARICHRVQGIDLDGLGVLSLLRYSESSRKFRGRAGVGQCAMSMCQANSLAFTGHSQLRPGCTESAPAPAEVDEHSMPLEFVTHHPGVERKVVRDQYGSPQALGYRRKKLSKDRGEFHHSGGDSVNTGRADIPFRIDQRVEFVLRFPGLGIERDDRDLDDPVKRTEAGRLDINDDRLRALRKNVVQFRHSPSLGGRGLVGRVSTGCSPLPCFRSARPPGPRAPRPTPRTAPRSGR